MVDKSKRRIVGLVIIFLMVIGDLIVGFADSPGKPSTFTQAVANTLYCAISSANCLNNYCNSPAVAVANGVDNCNDTGSLVAGYCPDQAMQLSVPGEIICNSNVAVGV